MSVAIRTLEPRESFRAARLLTRAFAADPVLTHFLNGPRRRRFAFTAFFRAALEEAFANETAFAADDNGELVAVAAWLPPDAHRPGGSGAIRAKTALAAVRVLFPTRTAPLLGGFDALGELHPSEPHWYLAFIGVEPQRKRVGIGAQLMCHVHARADQSGVPCYLETPFPETHRFYSKLGYDLVGEAAPFGAAPPVARFLRAAR